MQECQQFIFYRDVNCCYIMEEDLKVEGQHNMLKEDTIAEEMQNLLSDSFLATQNHSLDQPLEAHTLKEHVKNCEKNLKKIASVLEHISDIRILNKKLIISVILLCGEHSRNDLWTSHQTINLAEQILKIILLKSNCISLENLLIQYTITLVFAELRPKLLKNNWKNNPAAVCCFMWLLFNIQCPNLGEHFNIVLPTCLLLIDDHVYNNKIKGLHCLEHLVNNVSRGELNQFGRGSVIYNALEHIIYLRESDIIPPLGACLATLLGKTEHGFMTENLSWTHFDDVLTIWLPSMEMEQSLSLREAYIASLNNLLQAMGLASVRWSKKLLNILSEYCEQEHTRDMAILSLLTFMKTTWPRLSFNFQPIVVILMKVVINISKNSAAENSSLKLIRQCFSLLESICHENYYSFISDLKNCSEIKDCIMLISGINES